MEKTKSNNKKNVNKSDKNSFGFRSQENCNEGIKHPFVQVIAEDGKNLGKLSIEEALKLAKSKELDLVIVTDENSEGFPVTRIMNYSKKMYEEKKKNNAVKKKSHETQTKEIRVSAKISDHDLKIKMSQGVRFLLDGYRVKLVLIMKGRERGLKDTLGQEVLLKSFNLLSEVNEKTNKIIAFEQESDTPGSVCRMFYLKK